MSSGHKILRVQITTCTEGTVKDLLAKYAKDC